MTVYSDQGRANPEPRLHPYTANAPGQSGHVDFKADPDKIETALEDFIPFAHTAAVQTFYDFLRWINGPGSALETCDSLLRPPGPHRDPNSTAKFSTCGRVYILYRNLHLNSLKEHSDWLGEKLMEVLKVTDPTFTRAEGVIALTKTSSLQTAISNGRWIGPAFQATGPNDPGFGEHLMLTFWAYGDDEAAVFENLRRVFKNIWAACSQVSAVVAAALVRAQSPSGSDPHGTPTPQQ